MVVYSSGAESIIDIIQPEPVGTVFNTAVTANTDILSSDITIESDGMLRITASVDTNAVFRVIITREGSTVTLDLNRGVNLIADSLYVFDMGVRENDQINFQVSANATVNVLNVDLIRSAGP